MTLSNNNHRIHSFDYQRVDLKHSHWERQRTETIETYLAINNDDLLHTFRKQAGIPDSANGLAGWYGEGASTFGQKLGAFAKLYCVTGDQRLKEKAIYLADEWGKCAAKNPENYAQGTYVYEKLLGGFLDLYEYLNYEPALFYCSQLTNQAIASFDTSIKRDGLQDAGLFVKPGMIEWYTLPENLYRAYQLTGDDKYKTFAKEWDYTYLWDKLNQHDFSIGPRHAYSQVNSFSSAARAYEVTGDEKYLSAMKIAYDEVTSHHTFATGGYGPAECLFADKEGYLGNSLKDSWDRKSGDLSYVNFGGDHVVRSDTWGSCEVSCCAWAVFKFCNYMLQLTGEAKYGQWAEKMLYNGTGGQLLVEPSGKVMYYADYFVNGGIKSVEDRRLQEGGVNFIWQCCTGTFPQDVAEYANMLYYHDEESLYVSQYLPSKIHWKKDNVAIEVENYSLYPEEDKIRFCIHAEKEVSFQLKLRVPSWAQHTNTVKINGERQEVAIIPNEWLILNRTWQDGDLIELEFEFALAFTSVDEKNQDIVALSYGPLVLVSDEMTLFQGDVSNPSDWIIPCENSKDYTFTTKKGHVVGYDFLTRTWKPYYKVPAMEWYYMYHRIRPLE